MFNVALKVYLLADKVLQLRNFRDLFKAFVLYLLKLRQYRFPGSFSGEFYFILGI